MKKGLKIFALGAAVVGLGCIGLTGCGTAESASLKDFVDFQAGSTSDTASVLTNNEIASYTYTFATSTTDHVVSVTVDDAGSKQIVVYTAATTDPVAEEYTTTYTMLAVAGEEATYKYYAQKGTDAAVEIASDDDGTGDGTSGYAYETVVAYFSTEEGGTYATEWSTASSAAASKAEDVAVEIEGIVALFTAKTTGVTNDNYVVSGYTVEKTVKDDETTFVVTVEDEISTTVYTLVYVTTSETADSVVTTTNTLTSYEKSTTTYTYDAEKEANVAGEPVVESLATVATITVA